MEGSSFETAGKRVEAYLRGCLEEKAFPGSVLLVVKNGEVVYHEAMGCRMITPLKKPMLKDTIFDLASLTKPLVTATSVMILVEEGKINLGDDVSSYIEEFEERPFRDVVTVKNLLAHTSGLKAHKRLWEECRGTEEVVPEICQTMISHPPGSAVLYSDLNFILLGEIVQRASSKALDEFSSEKIYRPLGMKDTLFNPSENERMRAAATEECPWRGRVLVGEVHDENAFFLGGVPGHAGLFSTASDLATFCLMMLERGSHGGRRILLESSVDVMVTDQTGPLKGRRGLGWQLRSEGCSGGDLISQSAYGHTGFTGTSIWIDPLLELAVVFLTNRVHPTRENDNILEIRPLLHNLVVSLFTSGKA